MSGLRYLLDTDIVSDLARNPGGSAARRLLKAGVDRAATSIVVAAELRFGVARINAPRLASRVAQVLENLEVLPLDVPVDEHYAEIRSKLERAGTPIGPNDLLIAAHARALDLTLVSGNQREFARVRGLQVENWL
jgi:tRNA(fMet)-specific endonuclease VapC